MKNVIKASLVAISLVSPFALAGGGGSNTTVLHDFAGLSCEEGAGQASKELFTTADLGELGVLIPAQLQYDIFDRDFVLFASVESNNAAKCWLQLPGRINSQGELSLSANDRDCQETAQIISTTFSGPIEQLDNNDILLDTTLDSELVCGVKGLKVQSVYK